MTVHLFEQVSFTIQGKIKGFDEFMNLVLEDAVEIYKEDSHNVNLGRILLKGDNISLISSLDQ